MTETAKGGMRTLAEWLDEHRLYLIVSGEVDYPEPDMDRDEIQKAIVLGPLPEGQRYVMPRETMDVAATALASQLADELGLEGAWDKCSEKDREFWRRLARSVLDAALGRIEVAKAVGEVHTMPQEDAWIGSGSAEVSIVGDRVALLVPGK